MKMDEYRRSEYNLFKRPKSEFLLTNPELLTFINLFLFPITILLKLEWAIKTVPRRKSESLVSFFLLNM